MKRHTKEIKIKNNNIELKLGTLNKENPFVFYINGKCWIQPTEEDNYSDVMNSVLTDFKSRMRLFLINNKLSSKFIFNTEYNLLTMGVKNTNYFSFEIVFKQNEPLLTITDFATKFSYQLDDLFNQVISNLNNHSFNVHKKKSILN